MLITHLLPRRKTGMGIILDNETMVNVDGGIMDLSHSLRLLLLEQVLLRLLDSSYRAILNLDIWYTTCTL